MPTSIRSISAFMAIFIVTACMSAADWEAEHEKRMASAREQAGNMVAEMDEMPSIGSLVLQAERFESLFAAMGTSSRAKHYDLVARAFRDAIRAVDAAEHVPAATEEAKYAVAGARIAARQLESHGDASRRAAVRNPVFGTTDILAGTQAFMSGYAVESFSLFALECADNAERIANEAPSQKRTSL